MKYSIVLFPSKEVQEIANSYRKRYDPAYALVQPYIRLKEAFEADDTQIATLSAQLEDIAKSTSSFSINFHRASTFHPTTNVIFLSFQNKEAVEDLHANILKNFGDHQEEFAFVPHLTIGRDLSESELKDVVDQLGMMKFDLPSEITSLYLMKEEVDGKWSIVRSFPLA
ncbi:2'-5' RNA ligase family protein [Brevibacillus laterosporus]|uniref:2'-5' RNA ligase family protein n=1 Tax=Brevibacillus laterosporus TaxID=1465 RepID=UPI000CE4C7FB|nr:2'-5' RNA ligase family protein [Brevibacillus laterosporus]MED1663256.1 2'-5' RNA ligase family protein [Brevibacillus laterosporus]MED1669455.1 2'-5' RNA ligase family protein [Brevibacillus laterosporus]MED1717735.1 2'-5' RNA ligase family protein [Brevibacillus laterosporus]PPA84462.1 hypothetical protein C4A76_17595 [Brevibacillus laterosporus]